MAGLKEVREAFALAKTSQEHGKNTILLSMKCTVLIKASKTLFYPTLSLA